MIEVITSTIRMVISLAGVTSAMVAFCWTETVASSELSETLSTGLFDMTPTKERTAIVA